MSMVSVLRPQIDVSALHEPVGAWHDAWLRFRSHRTALVGAAIMGIVVGAALAAPLLTWVGLIADPDSLDVGALNVGPTAHHLLGADDLGRDLLSRAIFGARISLSLAILVESVALAIGGIIGLAAGYLGGRVDTVLMRTTDLMYAFPDFLFALVILSVLGPGYWSILVAVSAVSWPFLARLVRAQVMAIKQRDYIAAAHATGTRPPEIILRHIVPNAAGPVIVSLAFGLPGVIFVEAFMSFVGIGIAPPTSSWGVMISQGYQAVFVYPHEILVPAVAVALTTLSVALIGDGLRDAIDPRSSRGVR